MITALSLLIYWQEMTRAEAVCPPEAMNSEDMLFMLYTSGSTGQPKGIVHTQAGYLLYASLTHKVSVYRGGPLIIFSSALFHTVIYGLISLMCIFQYVFNYKQGDVFACVADIGWITGHSYVVYGPLCNGATTVLFESTPIYPNPGTEIAFMKNDFFCHSVYFLLL